jgi:hypothetical protein
MLTTALLFVAVLAATQAESVFVDFFTSRFYYAARFVGALLVATWVPLLIDRRARRSNRAH